MNTMNPVKLISAALLGVTSLAQAIEEPAYAVVKSYDGFEVRQYNPYLVAETVVPGPAEEAGNQGFKILADYIFGNNRGEKKIATQSDLSTSTKCSTTGGAAKKGPHDGAPFGKQRAAAEGHGVVFQRVPENLQDVALGRLDALVDLEALKALGLGNHGARPRWMASSNAACWPGGCGCRRVRESWRGVLWAQCCDAGKSTASPCKDSSSLIWQLSRLPGWRGAAVKSSMPDSSVSGGGSADACGSRTHTWQVPQVNSPPQSASMPATLAATAASIRLWPVRHSSVVVAPAASVK
jgi:hypothetical protein